MSDDHQEMPHRYVAIGDKCKCGRSDPTDSLHTRQGPLKVALITCLNDRYAAIADVSLPLFQAYAQKHGYAMRVGLYHTDPGKIETYGDRGKIATFNELYPDHDIVCFMDVDVLVMDSERRIEDALGERPFLWTYDVNGPCSGFWIAQCIPQVKLVLDAVQTRAQLSGGLIAREDAGPPHTVTLQMEPHGTSDQTTMRSLMHLPPFSGILQHCVSGREAGHTYLYDELGWHHYHYLGNYEPGSWLLTFPSTPLERRLELMKAHALDAV